MSRTSAFSLLECPHCHKPPTRRPRGRPGPVRATVNDPDTGRRLAGVVQPLMCDTCGHSFVTFLPDPAEVEPDDRDMLLIT